ncbi:MAG: flagellar protein FliT [Casimicrobiaceae bacterium]
MESPAFQSPQARMLDGYEAVATATRRMLDAARAADWNALDEGARDCETWMQRIERLGDPEAVLDAHGRRRRIEILCRVLRDDAQIRDLLHPSLGQVDRRFRHSGIAALR